MSSDDQIGIVCLEVSKGPPHDPTSTRGFYCHECAVEVWMSLLARQFWAEHPEARVLCVGCTVKEEAAEIRAIPGDRLGEALVKHPRIQQILRVLYGPRDPS